MSPLPDDVCHHFIAATLTRDPAHPFGRLVGDSLVRVPSASGPRLERARFDIASHVFGGIPHHQLQNHPDVYRAIHDSLAAARAHD